jgi:diaminopimelate epimerase
MTILYKAHGLGNDYLVLEGGPELDPVTVRALCDRHRGPGGDGILEPRPSGSALSGVRIWNPDGSVAEKSGNGLRIFAWWLHVHRGAQRSFAIDLGPERVHCAVDGELVTVELGHARFDAAGVPVDRARIDEPLDVAGQDLPVVVVGVGNPHCVLFRTEPDLDALPWRDWGRLIETHRAFPNRTNVQIARVLGPQRLEARIWERGAGPTLASGSSACAVASAAVRTGRAVPGIVEIVMPGGSLEVTVRDDFALRLRGPVAPVGRFTLDPGWRP